MAIKPIEAQSGGGGAQSVPLRTGLEAGSQSWKRGAPLVNSSGYLAEGGSNPDDIIGFAVADASGVEGTKVRYIPATPEQLLAVTVDGALSGSDAPLTGSLAQAAAHTPYGLTKDGNTGFWYMDTSKTSTNARLAPVEFIDPAGTVNGRILAKILDDHIASAA